MLLKALLFIVLAVSLGCSKDDQSAYVAYPTMYPTQFPYPTTKTTIISNEDSVVTITPATLMKKPEGVKETVEVPKLQNLLIENLGPYDPSSSTFGDLRYDLRFQSLVFNHFGTSRIDGQGNKHYNVAFEFRAPASTQLIAPVTGVISHFEWQPSEGDWEIHIESATDSEWKFGIDHIVSLDCSRSTSSADICDLPLKIGGTVISTRIPVIAGDVIGYMGMWSDHGNIGINGRTELTVFKYLDGTDGAMSYCPTLHIAKEVEIDFKDTISELMESYEEWSGNNSTYNEKEMPAPGCIYKAIELIGDKTKPVKE